MLLNCDYIALKKLTKMIADSGIESGSSPEINSSEEAPLSRTYQYRKVMKPLLERKRRARINKCLDNLKDIMVNTLQSEGESITKLEKADVLELTVKHLRKLKRQNALGLTPQATYAGRFRAGYSHCAQEVSKFMSDQTTLEIDTHASARLLSHLSGCIHALESMPPSILQMAVSPIVGNNSMPSPISPPLSQESCIPQPHAPSLTSLTTSPNPSALVPLTRSSNLPPSSEYSNNLAMVAATAHQYSALIQGAKMSHSQNNFSNIMDPGRLAELRTQQSAHLSPFYRRTPADTKLDGYRKSLPKSSSVLCGIDDKAWRPW